MLASNRKIIAAGLVLFALVACQTEPSKQDMGTVVGGVLGAVVGSQVGRGSGRDVAMIAGALAGAFIGSSIGKSMDDTDRMKAGRALETSPTGRPMSWRNPDTGYDYTVTPTRTYETASGPCRDFTTVAMIDGRKETIQGKACRQPDGSWKTM